MRELLFPKLCVWCNTSWSYICWSCNKKLIPHPEICIFCHQASGGWKTCHRCLYGWYDLDGCIVWFSYDGIMKQCIKALKYRHRYSYTWLLAQKLSLLLEISPHHLLTNSSITYVPSHRWRRYIVKWYNQSQLLAEAVASSTTIPFIKTITKKHHTASQVWLNRDQRKNNLTDAFSRNNRGDRTDQQKTIIIVDDVVTTGSTLNELARTIKTNNPWYTVRWLTLARHS